MSARIDRRRKDSEWNVVDESGRLYQRYDSAQLAVLMDLRDELKQLNALLNCHNFLVIPTILRMIRDNTQPKPRPTPKKRKVSR
jgi:hypothetical protein